MRTFKLGDRVHLVGYLSSSLGIEKDGIFICEQNPDPLYPNLIRLDSCNETFTETGTFLITEEPGSSLKLVDYHELFGDET